MPSVSKEQKGLFCLALSMKKGKTPTTISAEAAKIVNTMTMKQIEDFCKPPVKKGK